MKIIDLLILTFFCAFIYWLSDQSSLPDIQVFEWQDKIHHMGAYFIMAVCAWRAFRHFIDRHLFLAVISVIFCSLYGISDEIHQYFVPGRSSDIWDWVADTLGAILSVTMITKLSQYKRVLKV
jgi:VanZ family protein